MDLQRNITFMKKFFTNPKRNASIWPTSNNSAELLCSSIDRSKVKNILELGPGTWPVTKYIIQSSQNWADYYGIEYDIDFISLLENRFPAQRGQFLQGNVKDLTAIMSKNSIPTPDLIISTLPNSVFEQYPHLVGELAVFLEQWTVFRAITYAPDLFIDVYQHIHPKVLGHTWKNIPPLYVLWVN